MRVLDVHLGSSIFVPPMEERPFANTGDEVLWFVRLIPLME
jgi:oxalate decarboxylase/phosphoglucose isomerase-like protein (cupin superfamily)